MGVIYLSRKCLSIIPDQEYEANMAVLSEHSVTLAAALAVALIGFALIWPVSVSRKDVSLVDIVWGPGFFIQLAIVAWLAPASGARAVLLLSLVGLWSLRLGWTLIRRRVREGREDARYRSMRNSWGDGFWWKSLFIVFLLQAFLQWLIVLGPAAGLLSFDQRLGALAYAGCILAIAGLLLETVADMQLDRYKRAHRAEHGLLTTGLRARVRHPNYVGEMIYWSGIALIVLDGGSLIGMLSPVLIIVFLTRVSGAPLLDERLSETRPGYAAYRARVPGFIPSFRNSR